MFFQSIGQSARAFDDPVWMMSSPYPVLHHLSTRPQQLVVVVPSAAPPVQLTHNSSHVVDSPAAVDDRALYVNVTFLVVCFCLGLPLNVLVLRRLSQRAAKSVAPLTRAAILKFNLNISDILVFALFVTPRWCWMLTFYWCSFTHRIVK